MIMPLVEVYPEVIKIIMELVQEVGILKEKV
jgi:hypothetical protein